MSVARELGGKLFEAVFCGEIFACLKGSMDVVAQQKKTGLRLRLRLQDVPELADLPWEFLYNPSKDLFLAQSARTPIVRYIEMAEIIPPLNVDLSLKVLVMISSPVERVISCFPFHRAWWIRQADRTGSAGTGRQQQKRLSCPGTHGRNTST
jgi:hypothetical protein